MASTVDSLSMVSTEAPAEEESEGFPVYVQVIIGVILTCVIIVNIVGNSCTIAACIVDEKLRRNTANLYILNLAATDLLAGIFSMPFYTVFTIRSYNWPFGYAWCKIWSMIDYLACSESALTIILISLDRYLLVSQGPGYFQSQTKKKAAIKIAITWTAAWLLYGPAILFYDVWRGYSVLSEGECETEFALDFLYTMITSVIEFCLPFITIVSLNFLVYWDIRRRTRSLPGGNAQASQQQNIKKDRKSARALITLVIAFVICWAPFSISAILEAAREGTVNEDLFEFFAWLLWLNTCLNPFLYAYTNKRFREFYQRTIFFCCFKPGRVKPIISVDTNTEKTAVK